MTDKLCHLMDSEKDIKKVMLGFDFITAYTNIVAAWDYVSVHLIEKFFQKLGSSVVSQQHQKQNQSHQEIYRTICSKFLKYKCPLLTMPLLMVL